MPKIASSNLWFGSDGSFWAFEAAQRDAAILTAAGPETVKMAIRAAGGGKGEDPFALPPMWDVQNGVAQIHIDGSLINGEAGFMRLFGVTGYTDITNALMEVAASKDAKSVVLMIDSGGGSVNGLEDVSTLIQQLDAQKPVIAFTDGSMFSAAYWLGASARQVMGTKTSQIGSVGTLIVHTEYSKMLAADGVTKTMVRYGKYKALGNPYEPLTEDAKAQLQALADEAGKIFVDYVAGRRGMTPEKFQASAGEGRIFMGRSANEIGLSDAVMNYSDMMKYAKTLDSSSSRTHNPRNIPKDKAMKAKLSKKTILAIAQGVKLEALGLNALEANAEGVQLDAEGITALTAEATELIAARDAAATAAVTAATETAVTAATAPLQAEVATLKASLDAATGKVTVLEAASTQLTGQISASAALASKQAEIVKASISVMSVALGGTADVAAALVGDALLAEHERLKAQFVVKFPKGGVAAVNLGTTTPEPGANKGPSAEFLSFVRPQA